jgi:hypothetical protein
MPQLNAEIWNSYRDNYSIGPLSGLLGRRRTSRIGIEYHVAIVIQFVLYLGLQGGRGMGDLSATRDKYQKAEVVL